MGIVRAQAFADNLKRPADAGQGIANLVGDRSGHFPNHGKMLGPGHVVLHFLVFGEIPHNARKEHVLSHLHHAYRKVHGKDGSIFSPPKNFATFSYYFGNAGLEITGQVKVMLRKVGLRHEHFDILPNDI